MKIIPYRRIVISILWGVWRVRDQLFVTVAGREDKDKQDLQTIKSFHFNQ